MAKSNFPNAKASSLDCSFLNSKGKWDFQYAVAKRIANDCESKEFLGAVLASAVGSGKTLILIHALNFIVAKNPKAKILFLAYAQTAIKEQTLATFADPRGAVRPNFTFGTKSSGAQVEVAIPQEYRREEQDIKYSHLVIDEAHVWFQSPSVLDCVIRQFKIERLILATGTASLFNAYNRWTSGRKFSIQFISGDEMLRRKIYSSVQLDLIRIQNYQDISGFLTCSWEKAKECGDDLSRPIVVCDSVAQSKQVSEFLKTRGMLVALSTADSDPNNLQIGRFKNGDANALVIINRGLLGLNVPEASAMLFLKRTRNAEVILQALARIFRQHPDGVSKTFYMPSTVQDWNSRIQLLQQTLSLNKLEVMRSYCGRRGSRPKAA